MQGSTSPPASRLHPLQRQLTQAVLAVQAFGALATVAYMVYVGQAGELIWWLLAPFLIAWACAPYAGFAVRARRARAIQTLVLLLVTGATAVAFGLLSYHHAAVAEPAPQAGQVFLFIPLWQALGLMMVWLVAKTLDGPEPDNDDEEMDLEA